jgi:serpin B
MSYAGTGHRHQRMDCSHKLEQEAGFSSQLWRQRCKAGSLLVAGLALLACQPRARPQVPRAAASPKPVAEQVAAEVACAFNEPEDSHFVPAPAAQEDGLRADPLSVAVEQSNAASFSLWRAFAKRENFVASPYSIRSALSLVYLASVPGSGRDGLRDGLRYPERNDDLGIRLLEGALQAGQGARLESADAIWFARGLTLRPSYVDAVSRIVPAELHPIDFAPDPGRATQTINAWVSKRTRGKIPRILEAGAITEKTRVTLVNAVYLLARWRDTFDAARTTRKRFQTARGTSSEAEMMLGTSCLAVFCGDSRAALVDYQDTSLVFVVIVPVDWRSFRWDAPAFRRAWTALDKGRHAELELPKFTIRTRVKLGGVLDQLGISVADPELLSGVFASAEPSFLGTAIHEAVIEVDETSTEAAAATAVTDDLISWTETEPTPVFRVDQPFYFLLVERKTGLIAFMGQVTDPTAVGG